MKKIALISCVKQKRTCRSKAKELYISSLFKKSLAYVQRLNPDAIYILSAKYGLLDLETEIDPYNLTLNTMTAGEIRSWADKVLQQLQQVSSLQNDHFIILAGMKYRKDLLPSLRSYEVPLKGLTLFRQVQALSKMDLSADHSTSSVKEIKMSTKYSLLHNYLANLPTGQRDVTLSFEQIERVINDKLPASAFQYRPWWGNEQNGTHSHAHAWMSAGWKVDTVNLSQKWVRFLRIK
jgi:hypothetical protein